MNQRKKHNKDRRAYEQRNPMCEVCKSRRTVTTHHIVQKSGGSYEDERLYMAICFQCHDDERHTNHGKQECIEIKVHKGEWFETEDEEREFFGGRIHWMGWE